MGMINFTKVNSIASKYISSGLIKTFFQALSGFVVLRWIDPADLGQWQSFTVFVGYLQILTLGVTSGLNRELPYWLGKGNEALGIKRLKTAGYYTTCLSIATMFLVIVIALICYFYDLLSLNNTIMLGFAFSIGALTIQTNFLGATYRSARSFGKLTTIQLTNSILYLLLLPLVYFFDIMGYVAYHVLLAIYLYWGYYLFRPYKVSYSFNLKQLKKLIDVGLPMYIWNYLASKSRTIPRLILVLFGSPLLVGLFSPAGSVNAAMLNLPTYTTRYLFPQMSFKFGQTGDPKVVYNYAMKAAKILFAVMLSGAIIMAFIIPPAFELLFPNYVEGIVAAQIMVFSGVFYSLNQVIHNALNCIKEWNTFKFIVTFRVIYIILFSFLATLYTDDLLIAVSIGAVVAEAFNFFNYLYFFRKTTRQ